MGEIVKLIANKEVVDMLFKNGSKFAKGIKNVYPGGVVIGILTGALSTAAMAMGDMKHGQQ